MRTLIIDDSKTMRSIQRCMLEQLGYSNIEEASDGIEALSKIDAFEPDLCLVDWNMPIMDGLGFTRAFRQQDQSTPLIMVTTEAEKARIIEAIKAGVNNYVMKPFTPDLLKECITETLTKCGFNT